jgi:hypothetical protein
MAGFASDRNGKPLVPCTEKGARLTLQRARARVQRIVPFVIRLRGRKAEDDTLQPIRFSRYASSSIPAARPPALRLCGKGPIRLPYRTGSNWCMGPADQRSTDPSSRKASSPSLRPSSLSRAALPRQG